MTNEQIQLKEKIRVLWQRLFSKELIADTDKFSALGGSSDLADTLYHGLKEIAPPNCSFRSTIAYDYPTIELMTEHVWHLITHKVEQLPLASHVYHDEPIAIIGMSCKFPDHANNLDDYWNLFAKKHDAITEVPPSRFDINAFYDTDRKMPSKTVSRWGGFIDDIDMFDASFFKISPNESMNLDPQQRILLQLAWHALEHAGINPNTLKNSLTGVFTGAMFHDYESMLLKYRAEGDQNAYYSIGNAFSAMAGRIAYSLGLQGPCASVDTACSSSLVAVHQACQNLREGDCDLAIAAGVNLLLSPEIFVVYSKAKMLSRDGRCKTFSADANGYVRSEGAGVVILKRLSAAIADGDPILAVIRGSAENQDGDSSGITAPNGVAQERLLRQALKNSKLDQMDIDYIEAHGTGTRLGDPIEVGAISAVYSEGRSLKKPLIIGTAKTNIGHCESASGIAGLIKTVLSLQHEKIPQILHFTSINPRLNLENTGILLAVQEYPWKKKPGHIRRAGINSFGFSGINSHVIVEEAPHNYIPRRESLQLTQFKPERYWFDAKKKVRTGNIDKPFIYNRANLPGFGLFFEAELDVTTEPGLRDHEILSYNLFPGAGFVELILEAVQTLDGEYKINEMTLERPLVLQGATSLKLMLREEDHNYLFTLGDGENKSYSVGSLSSCHVGIDLVSIPKLDETLDAKVFYEQLKALGLNYGPAFARLKVIQKNEQYAIGTFDPIKEHHFCVPPAALDCALQLVSALVSTPDGIYLPFQFKDVLFYPQSGTPEKAFIEILRHEDQAVYSKVQLLDNLNRVCLEIGEYCARKTDKTQLESLIGREEHSLLASSEWQLVIPELNFEQPEPVLFYDVSHIEQIQSLLKSETPSRLVFVTKNHEPGELLGFVKSLILEYPNINIQLIDIAEQADLEFALNVVNEPIISCRNKETYVWRLLPYQTVALTNPLKLNLDSHILITGGTGALGQILVSWLLDRGVGTISVVSRSLSQTSQERVNYYQADVANKNQLGKVIKDLNDKQALTGIFHLSGVLSDGIFAEQTPEKFAQVINPKALGAVHLHELTKDIALDYFVMFSSIASSLGGPGQTNYAAANSVLDQLAIHRQQLGMPGQSIQWGPWSEAGMASSLVDEYKRRGVDALPAKVALGALEQVLQQAEPVVQIAEIDWVKLAKNGFNNAIWLQKLHRGFAAHHTAQLLELLTKTPKNERALVCTQEIIRMICQILGVEQVNPEEGFFNLGMDSLMSLEFRNQLQEAVGQRVSLPITLAFEYPNVAAVVDYLLPLLQLGEEKASLTRTTQAAEEPMAIIGMACRLPNGANSLDSFWQKLKDGEDLVTEIPSSRWNVDDYYSAEEASDKMYTRMGAFLDVDVAAFDASFFNISPKEARMMDPQQRLLLEVVWEALANAAIQPGSLKERPVGLYLGQMNNDYAILLQDAGEHNSYVTSGILPSAAAGRVSYILGLQGPCMAIDTACSSSLVALNSAIQSLREGESEMAIVAAVNLILSPQPMIQMCQAKMLSAEGHCKTFDASADGYTRGEAIASIILKPLSKAQKDGDNIWALVRASAVSQDGASSGLTVPNATAQANLIKYTLSRAGLAPEDIDYVEAHGTGTSLGDPIEIRGLTHAFAKRSNKVEKPLIISSTKTYLGHTESAAGLVGIIRTVLSMHHNYIPMHLHLHEQNPAIDLTAMNAIIPLEGTQWPNTGKPKRASVSSFGFSGIIAHTIIEEAPKDYVSQKQSLPLIQFKRERYWLDAKKISRIGNMQMPFIYNRETLPDFGMFFAMAIDSNIDHDLKDHVVLSYTLFPGAGFIELILEAIPSLSEAYKIDEMTLEHPLVLERNVELKLMLKEKDTGYLLTLSDNNNKTYASGSLSPHSVKVNVVSLPQLKEQIGAEAFYDRLKGLGLKYGPAFARLQSIQKNDTCALGLFNTIEPKHFYINPAALDCALQLIMTLVPNPDVVYLPFQFKEVLFYPQSGVPEKAFVEILKSDDSAVYAKVQLLDNVNRVCLEIGECCVRKADKKQLESLFGAEESLFATGDWQLITPEINLEQPAPVIFYDLNHITEIQDFLSQEKPPRLVFVTYNHEPGELLGFVKSLILEYPNAPIQLIDLADEQDIDFALRVINEPIISCRKGQVYAWRLQEYTPLPDSYQLVAASSQLSDLKIVAQERPALADKEIEIALQATGLNFRDVLNVMGLYPGDPGPLGCEGAGVITRVGKKVSTRKVGEHVFGYIHGGFCTYAVTDEHLAIPITQGLNWAQAAALPIVYTTAYYGLEILAGMKAGDKVLIHAAAGGVGLAAIELCQRMGTEIYATCSEEKRSYLKDRGIHHIYSSRDTNFSAEILKDTQNKGVDIVLNSLTSTGFIDASIACLKQGGTFLEIGKRNIYSQEQMPSHIQYHIIELDVLAQTDPVQVGQMLQVIKDRIEAKELNALVINPFGLEQSVSAFEMLQHAKNIGKLVITQSADCLSGAHFLITGGMGALGKVLTHWFLEQGVAHLSIIGRSNPPEHLPKNIDYYQIDITDKEQVSTVVKAAHNKHPLTGIFHLAGVLDDGVFAEQTAERFARVFKTKALGALYLHELTKDILLDYFVLFSSVASSMGGAGQSNYAAANSFLDQLAITRRQQGLPAQSQQWGPWLEAGMAVNLVAEHARRGMRALDNKQSLAALKTALHSSLAVIQIAAIDWKSIAKRGGLATWMSLMAPGTGLVEEGQLIFLLDQVSKEERPAILLSEIKRLIEETLGSKDLPLDRGFFESGMDSLTAIEARNRIQQALGSQYPVSNTLLFEHPNVSALVDQLQHQVLFAIFEKQQQIKPLAVTQHTEQNEPIAIIGMECRFPGGANNLEAFWELLSQNRDGISEVPANRWDIDEYYSPNPDAPGKMNTRMGGFLTEDLSLFDASFFRVNPRKAQMMDPQQRLLLETTWHALERAGIEPGSIKNTASGVYLGIATNDYNILQIQQGQQKINAYTATGNALSVAAGRIAHVFGLEGPALSIDTACSSSLVALHLACKDLRSGDTDLAISAGVNLILAPENTINFTKAHMLAPDGHCKTFDAKADGYVRGEGCGVLLLKRLSDAVRDGNPILALIKGSAINQDGASSGLTVPNGSAQVAVIQKALANAQVNPESIDYVEAHGTGTRLGDPIEVQALSEIYHERKRPLYLSSTKTHIGHLEAASGIAGIIRTVLSLQNQQIPAHKNFSTLNPLINLNAFHAEIPLQNISWNKTNLPRRAGISSFGFSGTNAHLILEDAPYDYVPQREALPLTRFKRKSYWFNTGKTGK